jgi:capsular exopolysaccharide synthesis family protein
VDKGIGQESVTPLEAASPPVPLPPQKMKHLIMAGLLGLILGIGIPIFIDRLDDRPTSSLELEQLFRMPVLAQFPLLKPERRVGVRPLQLNDERYPMIEAYRGLRSALIFRDSVKNRTKSIMISSARPHDGKSMVSANFAFTLAQAGARVLLIDADLRRGILHKNFSTPASPGLAEILAGKIPWTTAIVPTSVPNLDLVPCGESTGQRGNLFAEVGKFLLEMPRHYDYYLFDTSPVMVGDDVLSLAPYVDGVIMVVRAGFTSGRLAQAALESLHLRQVNVLGLVFNGVDPNASNFHYYRFKEYYPRPAKQA